MLQTILLSFITLFASLSNPAEPEHATGAQEIINIYVKDDGYARMDNIRYVLENLNTAIEKKLWNKYLTTGKMQDRLKLRFLGEVLMGIRGVAMDELIQGQENTLKKLCMKKYGKAFDGLTAVQQAYLKRKFPVLFQTDYL